MKRFLSAGEGYAPSSLANKLLSPFKRYIHASSPNKFGWLAYPSWVPKVTGIQFLVALLSSMLQHGSRLTRILLGFSSSPSRTLVEAHSKDCRSPLEGLSKPTRTTVEADSNNCRRNVEQVSKKQAKNPLKIQKSIYSALAGFFSPQLHNISFSCLSVLKPRSKRLWTHALCVCLSVFFLCAHAGVAKEADRAGDVFTANSDVIDSTVHITTGQRLPEEFWTTEFQFYDHDKVYTQTLEQYKGKTVILSFWSNTCTICINSFPKLNQINLDYPESIRIIPVNAYDRDSTQAIDRRFSRLDTSYHIAGIIQDRYIKGLFPHGPVPHYIWINARGRVSAITTGALISEDNILKIVRLYEAQ